MDYIALVGEVWLTKHRAISSVIDRSNPINIAAIFNVELTLDPLAQEPDGDPRPGHRQDTFQYVAGDKGELYRTARVRSQC